MNKSQELEIMVTRAEIYADEVMQKHETNWYGEEIKETKPVEETKDGEA